MNVRKICGLTTVLLVFAAVFSGAPARARLGDNCNLNYLHYGSVLKRYQDSTNQWHAAYATTNYFIAVFYKNDVSQCEIFYPTTEKFAPEERETLMKRIGAGAHWSEMDDYDHFGQRAWTNAVSVAILNEEPSEPQFLMVATHDFINKQGDKAIADANKKSDGF